MAEGFDRARADTRTSERRAVAAAETRAREERAMVGKVGEDSVREVLDRYARYNRAQREKSR